MIGPLLITVFLATASALPSHRDWHADDDDRHGPPPGIWMWLKKHHSIKEYVARYVEQLREAIESGEFANVTDVAAMVDAMAHDRFTVDPEEMVTDSSDNCDDADQLDNVSMEPIPQNPADNAITENEKQLLQLLTNVLQEKQHKSSP
ncbi:hypothetical protein LSH36_777g00013 [Paralvinella palmiformis]|uniref:Uncharacterized protein n=1 Tax=Paralvinella palmiformis TaxID=53620 RepID=A0AAD9J0A1_9ANNE|nr:hypothetical protein LSH36_777g00013 [Paralvinella palmiformis]